VYTLSKWSPGGDYRFASSTLKSVKPEQGVLAVKGTYRYTIGSLNGKGIEASLPTLSMERLTWVHHLVNATPLRRNPIGLKFMAAAQLGLQ